MNHSVIDSHMHLDHLFAGHPQRIPWMMERGYFPISWAFYLQGCEDREGLRRYFSDQSRLIGRLHENGLECRYLCGVHPRNISPDLRPEDVEDLLTPFLDDPLCLGIGEIGLEAGSEREVEILEAQLALTDRLRSLGKKFGVHTPRGNKPAVTRQLLSVLQGYPGIEGMTVIDHCTPETIGWVLEAGYWAGVTLSPIKASCADLEKILAHSPGGADRIMCNTDSGTVFYEALVQLAAADSIPADTRKRLVFQNAREFYLGAQ